MYDNVNNMLVKFALVIKRRLSDIEIELDNLCFQLNDPVLYLNGKSNLNFGAIGVMDEVWGNMNFNNMAQLW